MAQRSREIGVRAALGAAPRDIVALVARQALAVAVAGLAAGLWAAYLLSASVASFLYGVARHDVVSFVVVAIVLTGVSLVACAIPARRAAKIDPWKVLRS